MLNDKEVLHHDKGGTKFLVEPFLMNVVLVFSVTHFPSDNINISNNNNNNDNIFHHTLSFYNDDLPLNKFFSNNIDNSLYNLPFKNIYNTNISLISINKNKNNNQHKLLFYQKNYGFEHS